MKKITSLIILLLVIQCYTQTTNATCSTLTPQSCTNSFGIFINYNIFGTTCQNTLCQSEGFVIPSINCVINYGNGTCALSGNYNNTYVSTLQIAVGFDNEFTGTAVGPQQNLNQPTSFLVGFHQNAWQSYFPCTTSGSTPTLFYFLDTYNITITNGAIVNTTCQGACCINAGYRGSVTGSLHSKYKAIYY